MRFLLLIGAVPLLVCCNAAKQADHEADEIGNLRRENAALTKRAETAESALQNAEKELTREKQNREELLRRVATLETILHAATPGPIVQRAQESPVRRDGTPARLPAPEATSLERWTKLEEGEREYEARLADTTVYVGPDGNYHKYGCDALYVAEDYGGGHIGRKYVGVTATLRKMRDENRKPDPVCGAPKYGHNERP
jgi:hypothetical protein